MSRACALGCMWLGAGLLLSCMSATDDTSAPLESSSDVEQTETPLALGTANDPILTVAHGAALLRDRTWVSATPELVRTSQAYFLNKLEAVASKAVKHQLKIRRAAAEPAIRKGGSAAAFAFADLIRFLIDQVKPQDAANLRQINDFLKYSTLPSRVVRSPHDAAAPSTDVEALTVTMNSGAAYAAECLAAGVPTPPTWGSSAWVNRGRMALPFISADKWATVFTFTSAAPRGICIALPRSFKEGPKQDEIDLLGVLRFTLGTSQDAFIALSDGTRFGDSLLAHEQLGRTGDRFVLGDFNGDGRDDVAVFTGAEPAQVALSAGSVFNAPTNWGARVPVAQIALSGDFNNDRLDDLVVFTKGVTNDALVLLSNGTTAFQAPSRWHDSIAPGAETPLVGDFDGDSRDDIVSVRPCATAVATVALSRATAFGPARNWNNAVVSSASARFVVADVNGDGLDDLVSVMLGTGSEPNAFAAFVHLSTGTSFSAGARWNGSLAGRGEPAFVADVDADDRADAIVFGPINARVSVAKVNAPF